MLRAARVARRRVGTRASSTSPAVLAFRRFGHLEARVDPLGLSVPVPRPELTAAAAACPPDVAARLRSVYCGPVGAEFEHLDSEVEREWWAAQLEGLDASAALSGAAKRNAYTLLQSAAHFEAFLGRKYAGFKRYSGEGTESLLPALDALFGAASEAGVRDVVIGQAHRGRLALLVSLLKYPARKLFRRVGGLDGFPAAVQGVDDVTSHVSISAELPYGASRLRASLLPNPSHLEAVNPVAAGKARAKADAGSPGALCLLIHGDAAVAGQGVVAECYAMSDLPGYTVGGTLHVVTNNQLGFTAGEAVGRSSAYATDFAKTVGAPVLHVNAESLGHVVAAVKLAVAYRTAFHRDVVVDLIGYRRHGHNELDEPSFTQPLMYAHVRARKPFADAFGDELEAEGLLTASQRSALSARLNAHLEAEFAAAKELTDAGGATGAGSGADSSEDGSHVVGDGSAFAGKWGRMRQAAPQELLASPPTGVPVPLLASVGAASVTLPPELKVHDRLLRSHVHARLAALASASPAIDWATAEALAFGSLMAEGRRVRLAGQDVQRGTFSHRHAVLVDQATGATHTPLNGVAPVPPAASAGALTAVSSLLSEFAALGFEVGYAWEDPDALVLWEAQFGDFANGAQIIIDQFISGGESKWLRQCGLVMLLPHGYDGAGPEHSSARIERFLQLVNSQGAARGAACVDPAAMAARGHGDKRASESLNMLVANPSTPAQYFHLLRRQLARPFRKPLVVAGPKQLLRHPAAVSSLADMGPGTSFQATLGDADAEASPQHVRSVLLVSGKLYYDLAKRRADLGGVAATGAALVRVEELAPFPVSAIMARLAGFPAARAVTWVQEEPANAGAWTWAEAHLAPAMAAAGLPTLGYVGRAALAAPAVGLSKANKAQQDWLMACALPQ